LLITENNDGRQITDITSENGDIILEITVYSDDFSDCSIEKRIVTYQGIMELVK
jgi:hypothetical protein